MFGSCVETGDSNPGRLVLEATFTLSPEQLFDWFVRPEKLTRWWPREARMPARVGEEYSMSWPAMGWVLRGEILEYVAGERLVFTWSWDHQPDLPRRIVEIDLAAMPGAESAATVVRLAHGDYGRGEEEEQDRRSHLDGWTHFFAALHTQIISDEVDE